MVFSKDETFETAILGNMDEKIQKISNRNGKTTIHNLHFRDFDKAGKVRTRKKLIELGYEETDESMLEKVYNPLN